MVEETATSLPEDAAQALKDGYDTYQAAVKDRDDSRRIAAGKSLASLAMSARNPDWDDKERWPLPHLAEPMGITAEGIRQLISKWYDEDWSVPADSPTFPRYKPAPRRPRNSVKEEKPPRPSLSEEEQRLLSELGPIARQNCGSRRLDDPIRLAAEEFSRLVIELHERKIPWQDIANASGHTVSGIRTRAARHGLGKTPAGVQPYRRIERHPSKTEHGAQDVARSA